MMEGRGEILKKEDGTQVCCSSRTKKSEKNAKKRVWMFHQSQFFSFLNYKKCFSHAFPEAVPPGRFSRNRQQKIE